MNYKETENWQNMREDFDQLSQRVKDLGQMVKTAGTNKLAIFNQLLLAINAFDDHLKTMIIAIPEYYSENKEVIDNLLLENSKYMLSVFDQINTLNTSKNN